MSKKINLDNELKLMVALDLTEMDAILLKYVSFLCEVWNIEHLYFTHNIKQYKLYDLYDEFLEEGITVEDIVDREIERTVEKHYTASVPHTVLITSDDYTESILTHLAKEYKIDIVVTGNKDELQGTGALSQKLVRMLDAHVLLVPEEAKHRFERVLVPTDFSAASSRCFTVAKSLVERSGGVIEGLHVYNIPSVFFPYINTEKAIDKTKRHLQEKVKQFRKKFKLPENIPFKYTDREELSVVEVIELHAEKGDFDIVVVSARGGNNITSLFIGSVTNDLLIRNRDMPLLVVRRQ
ncbi:universal stress protein [Oceanihabitans sediminis]|uniref:Universal stress protein n=1 Tax=Oceanihabitans sediminis TaxID=1812012 RepID=A0A368P9G9_9FLAO|nr:universal stress protein [Oceanihabitans sediminis]MDX1279251.1 universal stress protein [Oceanihabitans sediminis]MDX1772541.1 universal stress protein [Oceanihabitans sediminis]RBP34190.1 nucleotide-binding universal stress UspA family protein [Oceanihabitans sediminis]RCU57881.1 universal stress protein [Oceanihabitans sediminis]